MQSLSDMSWKPLTERYGASRTAELIGPLAPEVALLEGEQIASLLMTRLKEEQKQIA
jgi:hypothetical protein